MNQNPPQMAAMLSGHSNQQGQQMTHVSTTGRPVQIISNPNNTTMAMAGQQIGGPRMAQTIPSTLATSQGGNDMAAWQANNRQRMGEIQMPNINQNKPGMNTLAPQKMNQIQMSIANQGSQINTISGPIVNIPGGIARQGPTLQQTRAPSPVSVFTGTNPGGPRQNTPAPTNITSVQSTLTSGNNQQSQQTSPAFISPSPSNMVPSPAGGSNAGASNRNSLLGAPSPSSGMINTPVQSNDQQQSPAGSTDERAYLEKVRQLQKYVEPLKRVIESNSGSEADKTEKTGKMKKLLDTLQNPFRRVPMETLRKCEQVLIKLEIPREIKPESENSLTVLSDAIALANKSPRGSHIIHQTLAPALKTLLGPTIPNPPKRIKRDDPVQPPSDGPTISNLVQGEVARLSPRFKVNLDCQQPTGSDDLTFICHLDDVNLPCVPPITLIIPSDYPKQPPRSCLSSVEYDTTDFLKKIREIMVCRQHHLPPSCTISMILDIWEMSIRQACSPKPFTTNSVSPLFALISR